MGKYQFIGSLFLALFFILGRKFYATFMMEVFAKNLGKKKNTPDKQKSWEYFSIFMGIAFLIMAIYELFSG